MANLERYADAGSGVCRFTTQEFISLLKFCGGFPREAAQEKSAAPHGIMEAGAQLIASTSFDRQLLDYVGNKAAMGGEICLAGVLGGDGGLDAYSAGQRKGLGVSADRPLYVLSKDAKHNTVLLGDDAELFSSALLASRVNWIITPPAEPLRVTAKTRYSQRESAATVTPLDGGAVRVDFDEPQRAITAGQAVVFYRGDVVVGGATIDKAL